MAKTIEERRAYERAYRIAHREKNIMYLRAYHVRHKAEQQAQSKAWKANNPDQVKVLAKRYRQKNREKLREQRIAYNRKNAESRKQNAAMYYLKNREEMLTKKRQWQRENPEKMTTIKHRYRARKASAPRNDFTAAQWRAMKEYFGHRCVYCERVMQRLEQDHIIPISKGGSHTISNIVPACRSCNAHKSAGPPLKPVQPLLL